MIRMMLGRSVLALEFLLADAMAIPKIDSKFMKVVKVEKIHRIL